MSSNTLVILGDDNYPDWARITKAKIVKGGAWNCITGTYSDPGYSSSTDPTEQKLQNAWMTAEGFALGTIQESIDAANYMLVDGKDSKDAWETLETTHNKQDGQRQFQLFQELANVVQKPGESLNTYHQRIEVAAQRLENSFPSTSTATTIVQSFSAFFSLLGLEKVEENDALSLQLSLSDKISRAEVRKAFRTEQARRDTAALVQESGLAVRSGRAAPKPKPKAQQKGPCSHCGKAHHVNECFKLHPEKMPDWMKKRNDEQRAARDAKGKEKAAQAAASDSESSVEESAKMTRELRRL